MGAKIVYERFIWFEDLVKAKRFPNASKLADRFEVSKKTAQRDIEFMRDRLHCPLIYDSNKKGYYYEQNVSMIPRYTSLSSSELSSLMVARKMLGAMSEGLFASEVNAAIGKITSILENHTQSSQDIDDILSFHLIEYSPAPEEIFRTVLEACVRRVSLLFSYRSPAREEASDRTVDPYHIFNYMGSWHVVGYCHLRTCLRDFRLNRIVSPRLSDQKFQVAQDFNFDSFFKSSFGLYKGSDTRYVRLRFTPDTAKWIEDQIWHKDQRKGILEDGSLELSFPVSDYSEIRREILKFGPGVEVIEPEDLRELIRSDAEKILDIY